MTNPANVICTLTLRAPATATVQCTQLLRELPGKRHVYAGHWGSTPVIIKLFSGRGALKYWRREKTGCEALQRSGVRTPALLYAGYLHDNRPVLLFEQLSSPLTALERWQQTDNDNQRTERLKDLYRLIAQGHQQGILQNDLHLDNFLYSKGDLYAVDGDGIQQRSQPLPETVSRKNLALLMAQFSIQHDSLLFAALPAYLGIHPSQNPEYTQQLMIDLAVARRYRRRNYVKKSSRTCSEFVRQQNAGQLILFRRDHTSKTLDDFLRDPDRFMQRGTLLKDGNSATVVRVSTDLGQWVIKRYNIKNHLHALKRGLKPSRAWISWRNAHRLSSSGIRTPMAIAMLEKRVGLWRRNCYYVCAWDDGSSAETLKETQQLKISPQATALIVLFRQLFQLGIYHGDCKATNFLLQENNEPSVIDLDAMGECRWRWLYLRRYAKDRQRFLANWPKNSSLHQFFDKQLP